MKTQFNVFVKKGILSVDYAIAPIASWADYVFDANYKLPDLKEVETFIKYNHHLSEIPSAKEVSERGYSQHELNTLLLKKIEELTLYIIEQDKKITKLEEQLSK